MPNPHYLDHASTSPVRPAVREVMTAALEAPWADASRMHADGMVARHALEGARERIAAVLGARPREVVFTSGATEAIASVCWGVAGRGSTQVVSAVEHSAVRIAAGRHSRTVVVGCDRSGRVDADRVVEAIDEHTAAVHLQWGNHEVGTTQPVAEVAAACRDRGVPLHVDAAQAAGRAKIDFASSGIDLLTVAGHKLGGPVGIGVLLVRRGLRLDPLLVGGEQERARRAGTENVIGALGLAAALESIDVEAEAAEQDRLSAGVRDAVGSIDGTEIFGHPHHRLPHLTCVGIADIEPQAVLLGLDRRGISVHSGSACASEGLEPSPVLEAMGVDAHRSLRVSVGWSSTDEDVDALAIALADVVSELRALRR